MNSRSSRKYLVKKAGFRAENRKWNVPNTKQGSYNHSTETISDMRKYLL